MDDLRAILNLSKFKIEKCREVDQTGKVEKSKINMRFVLFDDTGFY